MNHIFQKFLGVNIKYIYKIPKLILTEIFYFSPVKCGPTFAFLLLFCFNVDFTLCLYVYLLLNTKNYQT
jgi:hypothetical protein